MAHAHSRASYNDRHPQVHRSDDSTAEIRTGHWPRLTQEEDTAEPEVETVCRAWGRDRNRAGVRVKYWGQG
eukprot:CAMPEP_0174333156 /NCGR_PEP_ID=MMETSP0810-20121108/18912_1 /TAXON_ID=73025 ORGANISM="Eutreptiella gymnastica-like, Strain CCMP1594" /NCGR_SAMPLE_ID=MMETSP0810 /ASSEMBLY_ACC=CAM_ASM_000659 /LENGTH=70 /DNA_ID=CAMNT_0015450075 /DNA_START=8 /DNA_END=221 /DNA_ORIENTATION=+